MTRVVLGHDPYLPELSWPGLSRPSTTYLQQPKKNVDTRHKGGHDGGGL